MHELRSDRIAAVELPVNRIAELLPARFPVKLGMGLYCAPASSGAIRIEAHSRTARKSEDAGPFTRSSGAVKGQTRARVTLGGAQRSRAKESVTRA
jgi:hypothetical protein